MAKTVVIIGGSFGGLAVAKLLSDSDAYDVVLIERRDYLDLNFASPRLLTDPGAADRVIMPISKVSWITSCKVVHDTVTALHSDHVTLERLEDPIKFDFCVIASGWHPFLTLDSH
jgi:apoptosis-inducing factor 2